MLPKDPIILLSFVNTQLRDNYPSLDEFCNSSGENKEALISKLGAIGYEYNEVLNQFR